MHTSPDAFLRYWVLAIAFLVLHFPGAGEGAGPPLDQKYVEHKVTSPLEDGVFLPVNIAGSTVPFLVDTGSSLNILDDRYKALLGTSVLEPPMGTSGASIRTELFHAPKMAVGRHSTGYGGPVAVFHFGTVSQILGRDVHGVLGAPLFVTHTVTLDFDSSTVRIYDSGAAPEESFDTIIPLYIGSDGLPYVKDVTIDDVTSAFLVDTGAAGSITLSTQQFHRLVLTGSITSVRTGPVYTAGGTVQARVACLRRFSLGPFQNESLAVAESNENKIGLSYLRRFRVAIDLSGRRLYLTRGKAYAEPEQFDRSGLHLLWQDRRVVVAKVAQDSPAANAGLRVGDILLDVSGIDGTGDNLGKIRRRLRIAGRQSVEMALMRDHDVVISRFKLKDASQWREGESSPR